MITRPLFDPTYTSRDVQALTGVSQALQRDWRRRGILVTGTESRPGRWAYNILEVTNFAVVAAVSTKAGSLRAMGILAAVATQAIMFRLTGYTTVDMGDQAGDMTFACLNQGDEAEGFGSSVYFGDNIQEAFELSDSPALVVLDIDRVLRNFRPELVKAIEDEFAQLVLIDTPEAGA